MSPAHHNQAATAHAIPCPSGKHKDTLSSQKTQSGYPIVRWGILARKKSTENITRITKQNGEQRGIRDYLWKGICGGRATEAERSNLLYYLWGSQEN